MSEDVSKLGRTKEILLDDDPTDYTPRPEIRGYDTPPHEQTIADTDATINKLSIIRASATEQDEARQATINTDATLARQKQEIEDLRNAINTMNSEIERLNSTLTKTTKPTPTPKAQTSGTVNRILVVLSGSKQIKYPLFKASMTVGRSSENDIQIATEYVSRVHARITSNENGAIIEDLNSRNGVVVNSKKIGRKQLRNGDLVALGKMQFKFIDLMEENSSEGQA